MRVVLGIPCGNTVKTSLLTTVVEALSYAPCELTLMVKESCLVHDNRNTFARAAIDGDFTHLWMIDNDMQFDGSTLGMLLANDKDIVGAAYNYRGIPLHTTVKENVSGSVKSLSSLPDKPFICHSLGTGCILIRTEVFRKVPPPWFDFTYHSDGSLKETEDTVFCRKAKEVGIDTWCDPSIKVGHIGDYVF